MTRRLRTADVSQLTGVASETLRYWRWRGEGPPWYKLGRAVVYDLEDVERWIAEQKMATGSGGGQAA